MPPEYILAVIVVLIFVFLFYKPKETLIGQPSYSLLSKGMNLHSRDGTYIGGIALLDAAEHADRVSRIGQVGV